MMILSTLRDYLFPPKVATKSSLPLDAKSLELKIENNRRVLGKVDNWIDEKAFSESWFSYGVPNFIKTELNKEIDSTPTYTDFMGVLVDKHFNNLNYLEIGVSVGKNFFQMLHADVPGKFTAFDIESINPVLERQFEKQQHNTWVTPASSIKKTDSSLTTYKFHEKTIEYICADVWDETSWKKMQGSKFNLVFSDALHTPQAILFEFEMLVKYKLLDDKFIIVWDDLVGKMKNSFFRIIKKYDSSFGIQDVYFLNVNGWVGQHEPPHSVGLISNFNL